MESEDSTGAGGISDSSLHCVFTMPLADLYANRDNLTHIIASVGSVYTDAFC